MQIGSIGAMSFSPYVYNTNSISRSSLNKINALPEDGTKSRIDYTGLVSDEGKENLNPLKRGTSSSFADIISSQMAMSSYHKANIMSDAIEPKDKSTEPESGVVVDAVENEQKQSYLNQTGTDDSKNLYRMNMALNAYNMSMGIA